MPDLIAKEYALDYLGLARDHPDPEGAIDALVSAASARFVALCGGRPFIAADYTEDVNGGRQRLYLRRVPVVSVTSVTDRTVLPLAVTPATDYRVDAARGFLLRTNTTTGVDSGAEWGAGQARWRVVYRAGYGTGSGETALPEDVKIAVAEMVAILWLRRDAGESQERRGDWSSVRDLSWPDRIMQTVHHYREEAF